MRKSKKNYYKENLGNTYGARCKANLETIEDGSTSEVHCICPIGTYFDKDKCIECPIGQYCLGNRDESGKLTAPIKCNLAHTSTQGKGSKSSSECVCIAGYSHNSTQDKSSSELGECIPCNVNTYKDTISSEACKECMPHSNTNGTSGNTDASFCQCDPAYYFKNNTCLNCPRGMYCLGGLIEVGNRKVPTEPIPCPAGTFVPHEDRLASSVDSCLCNKGYGYVGKRLTTKCEKCPSGTYKNTIQNSPCTGQCGFFFTSFPGSELLSQCFCSPNHFFVDNLCQKCPVGAYCKGGFTIEAQQKLLANSSYAELTYRDHAKPIPKKGYFLYKNTEELLKIDDWIFIECPVASVCLGNNVCDRHMENFLCADCKYGYTKNFSTTKACSKCPPFVWNMAVTVVWYFSILLFSIFLAQMNVEAGSNRRSTHSIVIKIAINYAAAMFLFAVLDYSDINAPIWVKELVEMLSQNLQFAETTYYFSLDCLFRTRNTSYAESLYLTMLFFAFLPLIDLIIATLLLFFYTNHYRLTQKEAIKKKLLLLSKAAEDGLETLYQNLLDEFENDRALRIFRYIPLPGETPFVRFKKFMEDMIPVYVTVLFFLHKSTTTKMINLLNCRHFKRVGSSSGKYFLTAALSVECTYNFSGEYFKFFLLGCAGTIVWGLGIPVMSFFVLFVNRKNLKEKNVRLKYGFLHNGYENNRWYWETVVFLRKLCILIISNTVFFATSNKTGAKLSFGIVIGVIFLVIHLIYRPFDERDYCRLDTLETHSMFCWVLTLACFTILLNSDLSGTVNITAIIGIFALNILYIAEIILSLCFAFFSNVRQQKTFFNVPLVGRLFKTFAKLSTWKKAGEPFLVVDTDSHVVQLVLPRNRKLISKIVHVLNGVFSSVERDFFVRSLAKTFDFVPLSLCKSCFPTSFLEFGIRLALAYQKIETENENMNKKIGDFAKSGKFRKFTAWFKKKKTN